MLRLAFTSCIDPIRDPIQKGWDRLARHEPDALLLLGDNIYMDYGWWGPRQSGSSQKLSLADFSARMRDAYERQWQVASFRRFIGDLPVQVTWDDHDFGWDNAHGGGDSRDADHLPAAYRQVARLHFETFRRALAASPKPASLPPCLTLTSAADPPVPESVATTVALARDVLLHVLDLRSFRERPGGTLLGDAQRDALAAALQPPPGVNLLATSSTLAEWARYPADFGWLKEQATRHRILALSGDKHWAQFRHRYGCFEATASALAQPPGIARLRGRRTEVFGLLDIDETEFAIALYIGSRCVERRRIRRASWTLID